MKERLQRFLAGRYGVDALSKMLMWVSIIILLVSSFVRFTPLYLLGILVLVYSYYRVFSRNFEKRYSENNWYLSKTQKLRDRYKKFKYHMSIRKTHHLFTCSQCRQMIKVPKGKGKIEITCPKCHNKFIKRS